MNACWTIMVHVLMWFLWATAVMCDTKSFICTMLWYYIPNQVLILKQKQQQTTPSAIIFVRQVTKKSHTFVIHKYWIAFRLVLRRERVSIWKARHWWCRMSCYADNQEWVCVVIIKLQEKKLLHKCIFFSSNEPIEIDENCFLSSKW